MSYSNSNTGGQGIPKMAQLWFEFFEQARAFLLEVLEGGRYLLEQGAKKSLERVREEIKFSWSRFTTLDFICGNLSLAGLGMGIIVCISGFLVLGYQVILWLYEGFWTELPLRVVFDYLFENTALHQWIQNPESWLGLHQLVEWNLTHVPISLVLIVDGAAFAAFMATVIAAALVIRRFQFRHKA